MQSEQEGAHLNTCPTLLPTVRAVGGGGSEVGGDGGGELEGAEGTGTAEAGPKAEEA
jgi:hypothetical protein